MQHSNRKRSERSVNNSPENIPSVWSGQDALLTVDETSKRNSSPHLPKKILKIDPNHFTPGDKNISNNSLDFGEDVYGFYDEWDKEPCNRSSSAGSSISEDHDTFDMEKILVPSSSKVSFLSRSFGDNARNISLGTMSKVDLTSSSSGTITSTTILPTRTNSTATILCVLEDRHAPISCRSFENIRQSYSCIPVYIAMTGIRIIHDPDAIREIPEYQIKLTIDGEVYLSWKRFEEFRSLGNACTEYMKVQKKLFKLQQQQQQAQQRHSNKRTANGKVHHQHHGHIKSFHCLEQTVAAWQEVLQHRPWWRIQPFYHDLFSLKQESIRLENFLKHLLFEIPNISMLLEFIR